MRLVIAALRRALQAVCHSQRVVLAAAMLSACLLVREDKDTLPHTTGQAAGRGNNVLLALVRTRSSGGPINGAHYISPGSETLCALLCGLRK